MFSLARQLHRPTQQTFLTQQGMQPSAPPPDQFGGQDLRASQSSSSSWVQVQPPPGNDSLNILPNPWESYSPASGTQHTYAQVPTSQAQVHTGDGISDTDSDTVSTHGDPDYSDPGIEGLPTARQRKRQGRQQIWIFGRDVRSRVFRLVLWRPTVCQEDQRRRKRSPQKPAQPKWRHHDM